MQKNFTLSVLNIIQPFFLFNFGVEFSIITFEIALKKPIE